jgi:hypothetical protein
MVAIMNWLIATEFCLKDDWGSVYTVIIFVWYFSAFVIFTDTPPSVARHYPHVFDRFAFLFSFFMSLFYFVPRVYLTILIHVCFFFFLAFLLTLLQAYFIVKQIQTMDQTEVIILRGILISSS